MPGQSLLGVDGQPEWTVTFSALLSELARQGIKLTLAGPGQIEVAGPRGRLTDGLARRITEHKPELLHWLRQASEVVPQLTVRPSGTGPFPPSDLQTSFMVGSREGFELYVRPHQYMELDFAELDPGRFGEALNRALWRQRANLVVLRDDMLLEQVTDPAPLTLAVTDLRGRPEPEARAHIEQIRASMARSELPLDRWPWLQAELTRYGDGRARFHYNHNNFFVDGAGTGRFLDSIRHYYQHPDVALPELQVSYRDCLQALAELENSAAGQAAERYWRDRIPGWPGSPAVPLVNGADTRQRSTLSRRDFVLPADAWAAFKRQARARGLTPTTAVYGAYAEVICAWSGSRHFLLNNMVTRRLPLHPQIGEIFGNFASLYPLEVDWRADEPFADRVRRLRARVLADIAHVQWSGVKVLQVLNQARRTQGQAACPFVIGSGLFMGPFDRPAFSYLETPQVLLDCQFWEQSDASLWVVWDLIEKMFPDGLIADMQEAFRSLLVRLAGEDSAWTVRAFDLLPQTQRQRREQLNRPRGRVPGGLLHDRLARRADEDGSKPALIAPDGTFSYADVQARSVRLAAGLRDRGVRPGDLVAVALPRCSAQVTAVLAALTAGAAYVPVDPGWPSERIRYVLGDTEAAAVLTSARQSQEMAGLTGAPVLAADGPLADGPLADGPAARDPGDLAYVIYTSGSTGAPKGARLSHRGALNTVADINARFGIGPQDVLLGISSLCFDLSVYDIFGTLEAGATLVLADSSPPDPARWLDLAQAHKVTVWNSVPALMELLVAQAAASGTRLPALRCVLLSGDWIPVALPGRIREIAPQARVISLGGATEASIWSICYPVEHDDPAWVSIPYGKPLARQSWHVLDADGRDVPEWGTGHLYIGGAGVALGYHHDPARTAAAFVAHPRTGERLYRTGDLGRYLPGGDIEFLGRSDLQIKIQGFRVEPGEVEHALLEHPAVQQAAVVARDSGAGRQLAAFAACDGVADEASLREFLAGKLPGYLRPSRIVVLDRLPLTGNGKVDRRALEALEPAAPPAERRYVRPVTPTETALTDIWAEILAVSPVGTHDDFFELGGQSFAALRMTVLLAQRLARRVPLGVLLERRTVAGLARWLDAASRDWSPLVTMEAGAGSPWFFVHPAGGNVLCYRELAALAGRPFCAFQAPGPAAGRPPPAAVADLAAEYLRLLRDTQQQGPYLLGGWSSGAVIAFEMAHQLELAGQPTAQLVVLDAPAPAGPRELDDSTLLRWFLEDIVPGYDPAASAAAGSALRGPAGQAGLDAVITLVREQGGAAGMTTADLSAAFATFDGVLRACAAYRAPVIKAGITVIRAQQGLVGEFAGHPATDAPDWGWAKLTTGPVTAVSAPGSHHTLLSSPQVREIANRINGW